MTQSATTKRRGPNDVRIDLNRSPKDDKWRWSARVPGHTVGDSGEGYSRRIDCLHGAMRVTGVQEVTWLKKGRVYDYGQSSLGRCPVEFFIWKVRP